MSYDDDGSFEMEPTHDVYTQVEAELHALLRTYGLTGNAQAEAMIANASSIAKRAMATQFHRGTTIGGKK